MENLTPQSLTLVSVTTLVLVALFWLICRHFLRMLDHRDEVIRRYRMAVREARRWLIPLDDSSCKVATWIWEVGEGDRGLDIDTLREELVRDQELKAKEASIKALLYPEEEARTISDSIVIEEDDHA